MGLFRQKNEFAHFLNIDIFMTYRYTGMILNLRYIL